MNDTMRDELLADVAVMVEAATDGVITESSARAMPGTFADEGMSSLAFLRLIDAIEIKFGIELGLDDRGLDPYDSVEHIVDQLVHIGAVV
ncbi:phosphopantetheine-binding protein [Gordonia mangrovi]|uniref:phosphopantetheine-binding protein n=1 Tax=Gordonia mangrovi TaxID=2665643 RepID=UPI0019253CC5|nr:phosphopantetheine-binding protein [Gordonia mangrovi]MDY6808865.1 phosphopantetheine-binding protein [Actinomycetota bacterium]UVF77095.1 phosphopantetheine-binding protein [Gordonia mangrovi]